MARYDEIPVYKASYDLLMQIFTFSKGFSREYKFTLGEKLKNESMDMMMSIYRANSATEKAGHIAKAREHVEMVRLLLRLTNDLKQIDMKKFVHINGYIENVSRQLTGWQRSMK